ncbi:hypothetical protein [Streptomyces sp. cg35]|uniref:hypothetical protein n=1 Tax=Streptomyces sp. cg35 TaxID=3421650 RepID=UPI003D16A570
MHEDRWDEFRELHTQGLGRNAIAREMGINSSVISRTAAHLGLDFDRSKIAAATQARLADVAERRSLLAEDLIGDAEKLRAQVWQPQQYFDWGGKDHDFDTHDAAEPIPADKRALMGAAGLAIDRSLKLAPPEAASGVDQAKSMLGNLGELLTAYSRAADQQDAAQAEGDGA